MLDEYIWLYTGKYISHYAATYTGYYTNKNRKKSICLPGNFVSCLHADDSEYAEADSIKQ